MWWIWNWSSMEIFKQSLLLYIVTVLVLCSSIVCLFCRTVTPFSSRSHERMNESRHIEAMVRLRRVQSAIIQKDFFTYDEPRRSYIYISSLWWRMTLHEHTLCCALSRSVLSKHKTGSDVFAPSFWERTDIWFWARLQNWLSLVIIRRNA